MKKLIRIILLTAASPLILIILLQISFYLAAPVYDFSEPLAFSGSKLYNPYKNMDAESWRKYNFQVQSKAWGGMTDGRNNSNQLIDSIYHSLGFDYVATSDYMKINYHGNDKANFIPTYEHGYNLFKTHQVCIDASEVLWIDFIFFQTKSMKQWILDLLEPKSRLVVLAHPLLRNGYTLEDVKYLTNYQYMEVLNNIRISVDHWDTALSSGQVVWIMGNDDAHDVLNPNHVGRKFTMINSPSLSKFSIIENLKNGNAYGVDFFPKMDVPLSERIEMSKRVPYLKSATVENDLLTVSMSGKAEEIRFIGQGGKKLSSAENAASASYKIKNEDTYVRTEISFRDKTTIYLNPIIRYEGDAPQSLKTASVNTQATIALRMLYAVMIISLISFVIRRQIRKLKK